MYWISLVIFFLAASGCIAIFHIRFDEVLKLMERKKHTTLKEDLRVINGAGYKGIAKERHEIKQLLRSTGREEKYDILKKSCVILFAVGAVLAFLCKNVYLVPVFAAGFSLIPVWYLQSTTATYRRRLNEQLESALSVITTSYLRTEDIIKSARENMPYIMAPLRSALESFLVEAEMINASITTAIYRLKSKIPNTIFREWCDVLIQCQTDRTMKALLVGIVQKFSDVRIQQSELESILAAPKREAITMVFLVIANIPLLYFLNKDWFHTLLFTDAGKIALAVCAAIILFSLTRIMQLSKPVEYRGEKK